MAFCPECTFEYHPHVTRCPDCGALLVSALPEEAVSAKRHAPAPRLAAWV